jgi:transposase
MMSNKLKTFTDAMGRPLKFFMTAGQVRVDTRAAALWGCVAATEWVIADRGCDADWFQEALKDMGAYPCIPSRMSRRKSVRYDKRDYR